MHLFDDVTRDYEGPASHDETAFEFANRSALPSSFRVRQLLDEWFSNYPHQHRAELRQRFRASREHDPAFFELFLHELLLKLGHRSELHPSSEHTSKHPDFVASSPKGERFVLEAHVLRSGWTVMRDRIRELYDALSQLESLDFFIWITLQSTQKTRPSRRLIVDYLRKRLRATDYDSTVEEYKSGGLAALPRWPFEQGGWRIEFTPIPKSGLTRGTPGVCPPEVRFEWRSDVRVADAIRGAIERKGGMYGNLNLPYVIALNILHEGWDPLDTTHALLGEQLPMTMVDLADLLQDPTAEGAWLFNREPRWTRVSAVLLTIGLRPRTIPRAWIQLCHNPWAQFPYHSALTSLPQFVRVENRIDYHPGASLADIFGLPAEWPAMG